MTAEKMNVAECKKTLT